LYNNSGDLPAIFNHHMKFVLAAAMFHVSREATNAVSCCTPLGQKVKQGKKDA
jgi:hypothetical protein